MRSEDGQRRIYNSALLVGADGVIREVYDKQQLVPFAETVPFGRFGLEERLPFSSRFQPGHDAPPLALGEWRIATPICSESAHADGVRALVARTGANLIVGLSNDAWFGNTAGARQHMMHAMMRAIENDRDLLRVTNSGISALVTADGRVVDPLPMFKPGAQVWQAQARRDRTFYTHYGDWFAIGCVILSVVVLAVSFANRFRKSAGDRR